MLARPRQCTCNPRRTSLAIMLLPSRQGRLEMIAIPTTIALVGIILSFLGA